PARGTILQGGQAGARLDDGWEWDAPGGWRPRQSGGSAPAGPGALFHDAARDLLLFVTDRQAVWEGPPAGGAWTKIGERPAATGEAAVAFDPLRRRILVWGGRDPATEQESAELWQWDVDGKRWSAIKTDGSAPAARYGHVLVHDPSRESFFLYGGRSSALVDGSGTPGALGDGWELTITNLPQGEGCTDVHHDRCERGICVNGTCCSSLSACATAGAPDAAAPAPDAAAVPDAG